MDIETFWSSMNKQTDGCWIWQRAIGNNGYGAANYRGVTYQAHRLAWVLTHGPIPVGHGYHGTVVAHKCDVRACCNPDHLFLTDASGNQIDCLHKGRASAAKLTAQQVRLVIGRIAEGASARELADEFGVTVPTIRSIAKRRTWSSLTSEDDDLRFAPREYDPRKWRKADYEKIRSLLGSGKTIRQIARECGTTHTTVRRVIEQEKVGAETPFTRMNEVDRERIHDLSRSGAPQHEVAQWLGRSQASVSRVLMSTKVA